MAKSRSQTRLNSRLSAVATPMALIGKDRKVLFFNQGFERLTGWDAELVLGSVCEYTTEGDPQTVRALLGSLCPPPQVFEGTLSKPRPRCPGKAGRPFPGCSSTCPCWMTRARSIACWSLLEEHPIRHQHRPRLRRRSGCTRN